MASPACLLRHASSTARPSWWIRTAYRFSTCSAIARRRRRGDLRARLHTRVRRHRVQAAWLAVLCWPHGSVAQDEKPKSTRRPTRARDRLGEAMRGSHFPAWAVVLVLAIAAVLIVLLWPLGRLPWP